MKKVDSSIIQDILNQIKQLVSTDDNILLVFLFGSIVNGIFNEESDIDLGVYYKQIPNTIEYFEMKEDYSEKLKREVDIVVLNITDPIIRMQVLKNGLVVKKDTYTYNDFFVRTLNEYDDLKYYRQEIEKNILKGKIYA